MNSKTVKRLLFIFLFLYCSSTLLIIYVLQRKQDTKYELDLDEFDEELNLTTIVITSKKKVEHKIDISFPFLPSCIEKSGYKELSKTMRAQSSDNSIILISAFKDKRTGIPMVRIIAAMNKKPELWCHFSRDGTLIYFSSPVTFYEMCENHLRMYGGWILSCDMSGGVAKGVEPCFVSVGGEQLNPDTDNTLPIFRIEPLESEIRKQIEFGVCVPPLFGDITKEVVVQFVEMVLQLGATRVVFYNQSVDKGANDVLEYYKKNNIVTVLPWDFSEDYDIWYNGQSISINDCLYRHMTTFRHIMFMDLDEFLIPHKPGATTWAHIVEEVQADTNRNCGYSFKSSLFQDPPDKTYKNNTIPLITESKMRSRQFSQYRNKVMVKPFRILEIGIHHVSRPWPDKKRYAVKKVSTDIAFIHHYRDCDDSFDACGNLIKDTTLVDKYGKQLNRKFREILRDSEL